MRYPCVALADGTITDLRVESSKLATEYSVGWPDYVSCNELDRLGISAEDIDAMMSGDDERRLIGRGILLGNVLSVIKYIDRRSK